MQTSKWRDAKARHSRGYPSLALWVALWVVSPLLTSSVLCSSPLKDILKTQENENIPNAHITKFCTLLSHRLFSVSYYECMERNLVPSKYTSVTGQPVVFKEYPPLSTRNPLGKVLLIGGMHGNEYASYSVLVKWMTTLDIHHSGLFHWQVIPALNIDGLLNQPATRNNKNSVDLNRDLPTYMDKVTSLTTIQCPSTNHTEPSCKFVHIQSEPETCFLACAILSFKPDVIVSVHAPYGLVDYDGPLNIAPPTHLGSLPFKNLPTYTGSLGRFAEKILHIPILTVELASSARMPEEREWRAIWVDIVKWLRATLPRQSTTP